MKLLIGVTSAATLLTNAALAQGQLPPGVAAPSAAPAPVGAAAPAVINAPGFIKMAALSDSADLESSRMGQRESAAIHIERFNLVPPEPRKILRCSPAEAPAVDPKPQQQNSDGASDEEERAVYKRNLLKPVGVLLHCR